MKHHLSPGDVDSEKASCKYYILSGMESRELHVCWWQDIHVRIYKNFPTEEAQNNLIAHLIEGQVKEVIYDNHTREIAEDDQYDWAARQSAANYNHLKLTDVYRKKKRKDAMDNIHNYVFWSGLMCNFTYTI